MPPVPRNASLTVRLRNRLGQDGWRPFSPACLTHLSGMAATAITTAAGGGILLLVSRAGHLATYDGAGFFLEHYGYC